MGARSGAATGAGRCEFLRDLDSEMKASGQTFIRLREQRAVISVTRKLKLMVVCLQLQSPCLLSVPVICHIGGFRFHHFRFHHFRIVSQSVELSLALLFFFSAFTIECTHLAACST